MWVNMVLCSYKEVIYLFQWSDHILPLHFFCRKPVISTCNSPNRQLFLYQSWINGPQNKLANTVLQFPLHCIPVLYGSSLFKNCTHEQMPPTTRNREPRRPLSLVILIKTGLKATVYSFNFSHSGFISFSQKNTLDLSRYTELRSMKWSDHVMGHYSPGEDMNDEYNMRGRSILVETNN